jgi:hypothetical protein
MNNTTTLIIDTEYINGIKTTFIKHDVKYNTLVDLFELIDTLMLKDRFNFTENIQDRATYTFTHENINYSITIKKQNPHL